MNENETPPAAKFKALTGFDEASIDDKGRIAVNRKKRERLGDGFTLALGSRGCLVAYPEAIWDEMVGEMRSFNQLNEGREAFTRLVCAYAEDEIKFDAQNRFVVPHKLREVAKLRDKVVLIGCVDRMEIWAKSEWDEFQKYGDAYARDRREAMAAAYQAMVGA